MFLLLRLLAAGALRRLVETFRGLKDLIKSMMLECSVAPNSFCALRGCFFKQG